MAKVGPKVLSSVDERLPLSSPGKLPPSVLSGDAVVAAVLTWFEDGRTERREVTCGTFLAELHGKGGDASLTAADIRSIDPRFLCPSAIVSRRHSLLVSLGRQGTGAIILNDRVHLLSSTHSLPRELIKIAHASLARALKIKPRVVPFALDALEALLMGACCELHARSSELSTQLQRELEHQLVSTSLFAIVSRQMANQLKHQAAELQAAIERALGGLSLQQPPQSPQREAPQREAPQREADVASWAHELGAPGHTEMLLEAYLMHVCSAVEVLELLDTRIQDHEADARFEEADASVLLDTQRNRLIQFEIVASAVAAATGLGSCIAGIFGMNLTAPRVFGDDNGERFYLVASFIGGACLVVVLIGFGFLYGAQLWMCLCSRSRLEADADSSRAATFHVTLSEKERTTRASEARERWKQRFSQFGTTMKLPPRGTERAGLVRGSTQLLQRMPKEELSGVSLGSI